MDVETEIFVTSRSRAPSIIDVQSQNERAFAQLPDLIQEAAVGTEFSSPNLRISRVQNPRLVESKFMTQPMFYITPIPDSGIEMPDLNVTDEKFLRKYGSDLAANFADIKAHGANAFFQKSNLSNGSTYSLCACATGYIWVSVRYIYRSPEPTEMSDVEIQMGTFALKAKAITTVEIPFRCKGSDLDPLDGELSLLCSTVLGKYLRLRIMGLQYEYAAETAITQSRNELSHTNIIHPGRFKVFDPLLKEICTNAPMPPTSNVSLISRSMITGRWQCWRDSSILRRRYFFPRRVIRCIRTSRYDSIDLLSSCFKALPSGQRRLEVC